MYVYIDFGDMVIPVNLCDTPYKKHLIDNLNSIEDWRAKSLSRPTVKEYNDKVVNDNWSILHEYYYKLCQILQTPPKYNLPNKFDNTNYYLNILHRYFTTARTHKTWDNKHFDMNEEIYDLINGLNDSVHIIETYTSNSIIEAYKSKPVRWLELIGTPENNDNLLKVDDYPEYTSQNYNVYAIKQITGKDFITSFFDNDTANAWDIQNFHITYIGFCIDVFGDFKRIWSDERFIKWLEQSNYNGKVGYFPVGNIKGKHLRYLQKNFKKINTKTLSVYL